MSVALGRVIVCGLAANLVESDDQEQPPQLVLIGDVIIALADPPKEGSEHGLDNVFHTLPARQLGRTLRLDQAVQSLGVAEIELRRGILVALAGSPEQGMVARLACQ